MSVSPRSLQTVSVIETPEQVELSLVLAGVASRFYAYLIDMLWQAAFIIAALVLVAFNFLPQLRTLAPGDPMGRLSFFFALFALVSFAINFFYFALFEVFWRGQSPGKRRMGLRVVRDGGYPLDARSAVLRNLLRAADMLPANYFVGAAVIFASGAGKRIGDYVAGTLVIVDGPPHGEEMHTLPPTLSPPAWNHATSSAGPQLTDTQHHLLDEFLRRRGDMQDDARLRLATLIATQIAARLGTDVGDDVELFLERCRDNVGH